MASTAPPPSEQSTLELVRNIASDTGTLIKKEMELARQELIAALSARLAAFASVAVAGVLGLFALGFLGLALAHGLDEWLPSWASRLVVGVLFLIVGAIAIKAARGRLEAATPVGEKTAETLKEDVEWAKGQIRR